MASILNLLCLILFSTTCIFVQGKNNLVLIKPTITITTSHGDKIDCIDIHDQPGLKHPALKDHKIRMRPSSYPKGVEIPDSKSKTPLCPNGTVPIKRIEKYDMKTVAANASNANDPQVHIVTATKHGAFSSAGARISVHNPSLRLDDQSSASFVSLKSEGVIIKNPEIIEAGFKVDPKAYGDNATRFYVRWVANDKELNCDAECAGFVQVDDTHFLGSIIAPVSVYEGTQYDHGVTIFWDEQNKDWWLLYGDDDTLIGYWPAALFKELNINSAAEAVFGGRTTALMKEFAPPMGSGYFPFEGFKKAAYFKNIVTQGESDKGHEGEGYDLYTDGPMCYKVGDKVNTTFLPEFWGDMIFYGGPGGFC